MGCGVKRGLLLALTCLLALAAHARTFYVIVAGLGGEPEYEQRFAAAANDLDRIFKAADATARVYTLVGAEATAARFRDTMNTVEREAKTDDDFVLILDHHDDGELLKQQLETAIVQFHSLASHLYDEADLDRGYFSTEDGKQHPIASVSIAVVNGSTAPLSNSFAAAERAALLKKLGKSEWGSVIAIEGSPHQVHRVQTFGTIELWRDNAFKALADLARRPRQRDPHCLDDAFKAYPFFEMVFELDTNGTQRFPNWINPLMYGRIRAGGAGVDRSSQDYFARAANNPAGYVSTIYLSSASEDFCLTLSQPLYDNTGQFNGVLVADLNLASMAALLDRG